MPPLRIGGILCVVLASCACVPARPRQTHIAVVGASLSAGFCARSVAHHLAERLGDEVEVVDESDLFFFESPVDNGRAQVDRAVLSRAEVVLALDFLFWYASGGTMADVEVALAELARIDARVVVGDVPRMTAASDWILSPGSIPSPEMAAAISARLASWSRERPGRLAVPIAAWMAAFDEELAGC